MSATQSIATRDHLREFVTQYPWVPGRAITAFEAMLLRRYVARNPWRPGECGNGIVTPTGNVVTWAIYDEDGEPDLEGAPWHELVVRALYPHSVGNYIDVRAMFKIDVDGSWEDRSKVSEVDRLRIAEVTR